MTPKKPSIEYKQPSKKQIDKAGKLISISIAYQSEWYKEAYNIISQWRSLHTYPLNTFQADLRNQIQHINWKNSIVSQRLKRIASIITKLQRNPTSQLSRLQDIWWIRAVLPDMKSVTLLQDLYTKKQSSLYKLKRQIDRIQTPKDDWYRSIHMIFEYTNDRYPQTLWLEFEFQIRTFVQHAWATAVETIGTFTGQALKSWQGDEKRLEYFKYVSAGFCHLEWTKVHSFFDDKSPKDIIEKIVIMNKKLKVIDHITWFSVAAKEIQKKMKTEELKKSSKFFIITLDTKGKRVEVQSFSNRQKETAMKQYTISEQNALESWNRYVTVLVSIEQIKDLQKAYPSFFWDNKLFLECLKRFDSINSK